MDELGTLASLEVGTTTTLDAAEDAGRLLAGASLLDVTGASLVDDTATEEASLMAELEGSTGALDTLLTTADEGWLDETATTLEDDGVLEPDEPPPPHAASPRVRPAVTKEIYFIGEFSLYCNDAITVTNADCVAPLIAREIFIFMVAGFLTVF